MEINHGKECGKNQAVYGYIWVGVGGGGSIELWNKKLPTN